MHYRGIGLLFDKSLVAWTAEKKRIYLIYPNKSMTAQVAEQNNVSLLVGSDACNRIASPFYTTRNTFKNVYTFLQLL